MAGGAVNVLGYDPRKILRWVQVTGGAPGLSGKDPVSHILFIRDAFPDVYRRTEIFLEPVDYLNLRLTGRRSASFDTIAAHWVTDNRAIDHVDYDPRLLDVTGLDRSSCPTWCLRGPSWGAVTAEAAGHLGVPAGLPVAAGIGGRPLGGVRLGSGGRFRRPPLYRDVVVDLRPRAVQEDRPHQQRGLHSRPPWPGGT